MYELIKYDKAQDKPVAGASRVSSKEKASVERRNSHFDSMYKTVYHPPPFVSVSRQTFPHRRYRWELRIKIWRHLQPSWPMKASHWLAADRNSSIETWGITVRLTLVEMASWICRRSTFRPCRYPMAEFSLRSPLIRNLPRATGLRHQLAIIRKLSS